MSTIRKPDYFVGAMDKRSGIKNNRVGAAWKNDNGSISVVLNPFIKLEQNGLLVVTLFTNDRGDQE